MKKRRNDITTIQLQPARSALSKIKSKKSGKTWRRSIPKQGFPLKKLIRRRIKIKIVQFSRIGSISEISYKLKQQILILSEGNNKGFIYLFIKQNRIINTSSQFCWRQTNFLVARITHLKFFACFQVSCFYPKVLTI